MYRLWGKDDYMIDIHFNTFTHPSTIFAYMPFVAHENEGTYRKKKPTGWKYRTRSLSGCAEACWDASLFLTT